MSDDSRQYDEAHGSFLQRWSRRKHEQQSGQPERVSPPQAPPDEPAARAPAGDSDKALPAIDSLDENSEVSMFLSDKVSETIKRQALRKIFHMDKFNVCDGLDDYAEDYTGFQALGNVMTAHQRLRLEKEKTKQAGVDDEEEVPAVASPDDDNSQEGARQNNEVAQQSPSGYEDSTTADETTDNNSNEA